MVADFETSALSDRGTLGAEEAACRGSARITHEDRGRPRGHGRDRQHAPSTCPPRVGAQFDASELVSGHPLDAVVSCEALIHESEVRVDQVLDASVLPDDGLEEEFRLPAHGVPQGRVPAGKHRRVRRHFVEVPDLEPLTPKFRRNASRAVAIMRRTWATPSGRQSPRAATADNSSSGIELHRK
jgi:hypothetical protein